MKELYKAFGGLLIGLMAASCAQQGAPTGGPKDEEPPVVVESKPVNYSVNFDAKRIEITFDEYLDMGNFAQELVVSPPMKEKPVVKMKGKTLLIEFEEELHDDATYTFNFGEGIKDLNERNILMNYEFVFATGEKLDSLSIKGKLRNAFDLSIPESPIYVMLYNTLYDSLPLTDIPYYIGRTDEEGNYAVNNLRADVYKMFVLKDGNNNFLFDNPTEQIAFLDSSIQVDGTYFRELMLASGEIDSTAFLPDTAALSVDTTGMSADSIQMVLDSIAATKPDFNTVLLDLYMFTEDETNQYLSEYERAERRRIDMVFNVPLGDSFSYEAIGLPMQSFIPEYGIERDSLKLWARDTSIAALDTIELALSYVMKDSIGLPYLHKDTLSFVFREKAKSSSRSSEARKGAQSESEADSLGLVGKVLDPLTVHTIKKNGVQAHYRALFFRTDEPLREIDESKFELFAKPDTIELAKKVSPVRDSSSLYKAMIDFKWEQDMKYVLRMYPGAMTSIYEETNDSLEISFTTSADEDYGVMIVKLNEFGADSVLIQLLQKDVVVREQVANHSGENRFTYLKPQTYSIKLVVDRNGNGKWDTGKYLEGLQPEWVEYVPNRITVRENWEHEIAYTKGMNDGPVREEKKEDTGETEEREDVGRGSLNDSGGVSSGSRGSTPRRSGMKPGGAFKER